MRRGFTVGVLGDAVAVDASWPLVNHLEVALALLRTTPGSTGPVRHRLHVERSRTNSWAVRWNHVEHYRGRSPSTALYAALGALDEHAGSAARRRDAIGLHGAGVRIDGHGVTLVGHSGSGKSTLAAAFVRRGHGYVSDELAAVDLSGTLLAYPRPVGLRRGGAAAVACTIPPGPFDEIYPWCPDRSASDTPLRVIALVDREPGGDDSRLLSPAEALARLSNHTLGTEGDERWAFRRLDALVRSTPVVAVSTPDLDAGVRRIEGAVATTAG